MSQPQTYANHRRLEPIQHFFLTPILLGIWITTLVQFFRHPTLHTGGVMVLAVVALFMALQTRMYALKVQDRLIRLEETLRMERLLPENLRARLGELRPSQFVALRFASDAELSDRVRETLDQKLGAKEIKRRIQTWRPDTFRV